MSNDLTPIVAVSCLTKWIIQPTDKFRILREFVPNLFLFVERLAQELHVESKTPFVRWNGSDEIKRRSPHNDGSTVGNEREIFRVYSAYCT